jgi:hypothetical protein
MHAEHLMIIGDQTIGNDIALCGTCVESPSRQSWIGDAVYFKVKICQGVEQVSQRVATVAHVSLMRGQLLIWQSAPHKCRSVDEAIQFLRNFDIHASVPAASGQDLLFADYRLKVDEIAQEAQKQFE